MLMRLSTILLSTMVLAACQSVPKNHTASDGNTMRVGNVIWDKAANQSYAEVLAQPIGANQSRVVFIRPMTNTYDQSSANIALNNRYLTSLQAGHYTQSLVCSGVAMISVQPTGEKSNDLTAQSHQLELKPNQTYYFYVDVDKTSNQPTLSAISAEQARQHASGKQYQTHQVSRVINQCQPPVIKVAPAVIIEAPISTVIAPTTMRLNVLFDTNQSTLKSQEQTDIAKLAAYLKEHPTTTVIIEGHTDSTGSAAHNLRLSQARADTVKQTLISRHGIAADRLTAKGYGASQPIADNATVAGREQNRRVMVVIN